jgi:amidophosphoribosyltransferase
MQVRTTNFFDNLKYAIDARGGTIIIGGTNFISEKFVKFSKRYFGTSALINIELDDGELQDIVQIVSPKYVIDLSSIEFSSLLGSDYNRKKKFEVHTYTNGECVTEKYELPNLIGSCEFKGDTFLFEQEISRQEKPYNVDDFNLIDAYLNTFFKRFKPSGSDFIHNPDINLCLKSQQYCSVKYLYKAKPTETLHGINIAEFRIALGQALAREISTENLSKIDYIIPVPNSGNFYAVGLSKETGIPYLPALSKIDVSERAFEIQDVNMRKRYLSENMFVNEQLIKGKDILLVDEAIFTGATLKSVCELVYSAGAKSVNIAIPSPYCFTNCEFYIQPERTLLLHKVQKHAVTGYFGVDSVTHIDKATYKETIFNFKKDYNFCMSCFNLEDANNV